MIEISICIWFFGHLYLIDVSWHLENKLIIHVHALSVNKHHR